MERVAGWLDIRLTGKVAALILLISTFGFILLSILRQPAWSQVMLLVLAGYLTLSVIVRGYWRLGLRWQPTVSVIGLLLAGALYVFPPIAFMNPWIAYRLALIPFIVAFILWYRIV